MPSGYSSLTQALDDPALPLSTLRRTRYPYRRDVQAASRQAARTQLVRRGEANLGTVGTALDLVVGYSVNPATTSASPSTPPANLNTASPSTSSPRWPTCG